MAPPPSLSSAQKTSLHSGRRVASAFRAWRVTLRVNATCTRLNAHNRESGNSSTSISISRRDALGLSVAGSAMLVFGSSPAHAIQGLIAGRIPGLSKDADENGFFTYTRPEGKSGGHGVGWSEIPQYKFKVPAGWDEIPVSIADLGGTEIDLRYQSRDAGDIAVVVAPVLRFMDLGFNAKVTLKDVGPPQRVIEGFAPELFGRPLDEGDVLDTQVMTREDGGLYYLWDLKPHNLVAATATKNRVFILSVTASARQWKKHSAELKVIQQSFRVQQDL